MKLLGVSVGSEGVKAVLLEGDKGNKSFTAQFRDKIPISPDSHAKALYMIFEWCKDLEELKKKHLIDTVYFLGTSIPPNKTRPVLNNTEYRGAATAGLYYSFRDKLVIVEKGSLSKKAKPIKFDDVVKNNDFWDASGLGQEKILWRLTALTAIWGNQYESR